MIDTSSKTEKVAETPFKIDLQMFADDDPVEPSTPSEPDASAEPSEPVDSDPTEPSTPADSPDVADPDQVKPVQGHDTNRAFQQMRKQIQEAENFARSMGYDSFTEMKQVQIAQAYVAQGVDPISASRFALDDIRNEEIAEQHNTLRIANEKAALSGKKHFKELESEIDAMLGADSSLSVEACFNFVRGVKADELAAKEAKAAAQRTLNNVNGKAHIKPDGAGADIETMTIDDEEFSMAKKLMPNITKEEFIKFKKTQKG